MFNPDENRHSRNRTNFSLTAIFAVLLGIVFLLNNFGILPWEVWQNVWKFWPVLLILFGIETVLGRSASPRSFGFLLFLVFALPLILILNPLTGNPLATKKLSFTKPLGNLTKASFSFNLPSNNIKIGTLSDAQSGLFFGELRYSALLPIPTLADERRFSEAKYTFSQAEQNKIPFSNNLGNSGVFNFTNLIPLEMLFKSTTGVFDLNLEKLRVSYLEIDAIAGSSTVKFAPDFSTKTFIKSQAQTITLKIPKQTEASIKVTSAFKALNLDQTRFKKLDETFYKTISFDQATVKVEVEIAGSASNITVEQF